MLLKNYIICVSIFFISATSIALAEPTSNLPQDSSSTAISINIDCQHDFNIDKGNTQDCLSISKLKVSHTQKIGNKISADITLNPFARTDSSADRYPYNKSAPSSKSGLFGIVDSYALIWTPRPNLELAVEEYSNASLIPNTSGLSMASGFDSSGWSQTAISATYHLPAVEGIDVKFVLGNGEGENGENLDPQQYFGFEFRAVVIKGFEFNVGAGFDGNSIGSSRQSWLESSYSDCESEIVFEKVDTGYATRRLAGGVTLNGDLATARGLLFGLGWQKITLSDLNKDKPSVPSSSELASCSSLDVGELFLEDSLNNSANTVTQSIFGFNGSYRVLDTYILGFDYQTRTVETGVVSFFEPCESFVGESCNNRKSPQNILTQLSLTYGITYELSRELALVAEYNVTEYDQAYNKFRYSSVNKGLSEKSEIFNARIAYRWK